MDSPVVFVYADWLAAYPELSYVNSVQAQGYFQRAQMFCDNSSRSIIPNCQPLYLRAMLLGLVTAHIASMNAPTISNGQSVPASPLVGRISNATEGSVNATTEMSYPAGSAQWFNQTRYGAEAYGGMAQFRSMLYVPGPVPPYNPYFPQTIVSR